MPCDECDIQLVILIRGPGSQGRLAQKPSAPNPHPPIAIPAEHTLRQMLMFSPLLHIVALVISGPAADCQYRPHDVLEKTPGQHCQNLRFESEVIDLLLVVPVDVGNRAASNLPRILTEANRAKEIPIPPSNDRRKGNLKSAP